eukprot:TRINITY_DN37794_c0_g1_i1.p2 TRINITY_DN37794_c0_g1~~TRINITY_DN37794_c0_g1_i1.p2  ORF type:complete len:293 (+),score=71.61 TRINITY_DN37794_c0_g1_i1:55-879(+)
MAAAAAAVVFFAAAAVAQPQTFSFPRAVAWNFTFELSSGIRGSGFGRADWGESDAHPRYLLEETYSPATPSAHWAVRADRTAGSGGDYRYAYEQRDGRRGCAPARLSAFPRHLFRAADWVGSVVHQGADCQRWAAAMDLGTPGTLELTACGGAPVETKWTWNGAATAEQRCAITAFREVPSLDAAEAERVFAHPDCGPSASPGAAQQRGWAAAAQRRTGQGAAVGGACGAAAAAILAAAVALQRRRRGAPRADPRGERAPLAAAARCSAAYQSL